jgi:hypothetical protein
VRWHLDEVFVSINGRQLYVWRAVDSEGEVLVVREMVCAAHNEDLIDAPKAAGRLNAAYARPGSTPLQWDASGRPEMLLGLCGPAAAQ